MWAWMDEDGERKQRGSREEHEWDAKTLVGRDGENRDDETLREGDDSGEADRS